MNKRLDINLEIKRLEDLKLRIENLIAFLNEFKNRGYDLN